MSERQIKPDSSVQSIPHPQTASLLIELLTEELPPKSLRLFSERFSASILEGLLTHQWIDRVETGQYKRFATPRRLGLLVREVRSKGLARERSAKGPSIQIGLDADGKPTQALIKWAARQGASIDALERVNDGKQTVFAFRHTEPGASLDEGLESVIVKAISDLPIPKLMQYQLADGQRTVSFVRPAHALTVLHGERLLPVKLLGLEADRFSQGHRFQGAARLYIDHADHYESILRHEGAVIVDMDERKAAIHEALMAQAKALDAHLGEDQVSASLLEEVSALVERGAVYCGKFDDDFLKVPQECLMLTMRTNQKYFPLFDAQEKLLPRFLIVSNMTVDDPSLIIDGNERVVRPRLADAGFFFQQDQKQTLEARLPQLEQVIYHAKLGSQAERAQRVASIAAWIASQGALDATLATRAALLAKTDLLTAMVGEFPALQGIMGRYYALIDGEDAALADAIAEQYLPRFAGDALAKTPLGTVLALADKLETLCGLFAIGQLPTGDKDPFALRRQALGVLRMLLERKLDLSLPELIDCGLRGLAERQTHASASADLMRFFNDRLAVYLREQGWAQDLVQALLARPQPRLYRLHERLEALQAFSKQEAASSLAAANRRIGNLLRKQGDEQEGPVDEACLQEPAELALWARVCQLKPQIEAAMANHEDAAVFTLLAEARPEVDQFFESIMVMAEDPKLRRNRIALLAVLHGMMNQLADLSALSEARA
ncbi:MAG: glycine--tRNA ligase subunit beta [Betaproteobacteria bacterium]|nr:glycine--tRNA ligase subunit beta [Betaproteobacteria bacterium]NBP37564.1 glycine--tRNA ligase subunit beta [Betaproteobacteria bacterium]NBS38402.1 glycine--tRNA ligase subunit beta [Betaproteobacteria bacterium]NCV13083.1 glycine--tRNA ligase subunit beta [Betaproteobacteria bacterium]NCY05820.1 glycine--tRNA ligase subunit beta [Betaproteobacteria bacterium]